MPYSPLYTSQAKVTGLTQFTPSDTTQPTSTQVLTWIEEVEADIDARALGNYVATDQIVDVPAHIDYPAKDTIAWLEAMGFSRWEKVENRLLIPPFTPIVSITSLYRRTTSETEAASWEQLTEGPGVNTSFLLLKRRTKAGRYLGFAVYFYQNPPTVGYQRVKMTYNYGYNIPATILSDYATLRVARAVLLALSQTPSPSGLRQFVGGDLQTYVPVEYRTKLEEIEKRIKAWESEWLEHKMGVAFI